MMCEPDHGIPFISLSWAGMAGVVSGMNRAGVSVTVNGAPSSLPSQTATPVAMVARDILEKAHDLDEALFLADRIVLLRDGKLMADLSPQEFVDSREPEIEAYIRAFHRIGAEASGASARQAEMRR